VVQPLTAPSCFAAGCLVLQGAYQQCVTFPVHFQGEQGILVRKWRLCLRRAVA